MNVFIKDVIFYYASVQSPKPNYGKTGNEYSVQALITKDEMQRLKAMKVNKTFKNIEDEGLLDKYPEGKGRYLVSFKCPESSSTGKELSIRVVDASGKPMEDLIGNGSKGQLKLWLMEGQGLSKGKMNARLNAMMVEVLKEYHKKSGDEDFEYTGSTKRIQEDELNDKLDPF
jgi:hypothetical protein